jgi:hypothetical protein
MLYPFKDTQMQMSSALLNQNYLDSRAVFMQLFQKLPCMAVITQMDASAAFAFIRERYAADIVNVYQHSYYHPDDDGLVFNISLFQLNKDRLIEVGAGYVELLHTSLHYDWAREVIAQLATMRQPVEVVMAEPQPTTVLGFARRMNEN